MGGGPVERSVGGEGRDAKHARFKDLIKGVFLFVRIQIQKYKNNPVRCYIFVVGISFLLKEVDCRYPTVAERADIFFQR